MLTGLKQFKTECKNHNKQRKNCAVGEQKSKYKKTALRGFNKMMYRG